MNQEAAQKALYKMSTAMKELADAFGENLEEAKSKEEREIELMLEFDKPAGQGLTQEGASKACRKHGLRPQIVGAWANGGYIVTNRDEDPPRRYLTNFGRNWLRDQEGVSS